MTKHIVKPGKENVFIWVFINGEQVSGENKEYAELLNKMYIKKAVIIYQPEG